MDKDQKLEKFERLATKRVASALHAIALVSNLSNRTTYHYTQEHVDQMFTALKDAVAKAEASFQAKPEAATQFAFSGIDTSHVDFHDEDEGEDESEDEESDDMTGEDDHE